MEPKDIYSEELTLRQEGMFGKHTSKIHQEELQKIPLLKAFWEDNDVQEITIVSTNFGFIKTFSKSYKP